MPDDEAVEFLEEITVEVKVSDDLVRRFHEIFKSEDNVGRKLSEEAKYSVDKDRYQEGDFPSKGSMWGEYDTDIEVNAKLPDGSQANVDLKFLDKPSLDRFLRSRGGNNELAEDVVRELLGHPLGEGTE